MINDWLGSTGRDDLLEQLQNDLSEVTDRVRYECEEIINHAIDNAYELGYQDGQEAAGDE